MRIQVKYFYIQIQKEIDHNVIILISNKISLISICTPLRCLCFEHVNIIYTLNLLNSFDVFV